MNVLSVVITFIVMMLFVIFVSILILDVIDIFKEEKAHKKTIIDIDKLINDTESIKKRLDVNRAYADIQYKIKIQKRYVL